MVWQQQLIWTYSSARLAILMYIRPNVLNQWRNGNRPKRNVICVTNILLTMAKPMMATVATNDVASVCVF